MMSTRAPMREEMRKQRNGNVPQIFSMLLPPSISSSRSPSTRPWPVAPSFSRWSRKPFFRLQEVSDRQHQSSDYARCDTVTDGGRKVRKVFLVIVSVDTV